MWKSAKMTRQKMRRVFLQKRKKHQIRTFDNEEEFDDWINKEPNWTRWSRCIHVNIIEDGALNV